MKRRDDWVAQPLYGDGNSRKFAMERALDYIAHEPGRHVGIYKLVAIVRGTVEFAVEELENGD